MKKGFLIYLNRLKEYFKIFTIGYIETDTKETCSHQSELIEERRVNGIFANKILRLCGFKKWDECIFIETVPMNAFGDDVVIGNKMGYVLYPYVGYGEHVYVYVFVPEYEETRSVRLDKIRGTYPMDSDNKFEQWKKKTRKIQLKTFYDAMDKIDFGFKIESEKGIGVVFPFEQFKKA